MKYLRCANGQDVVADDLPPVVRAVALLLEHANGRQAAGLSLPCRCGECVRHRGAVVCTKAPDGSLVVEATTV